MKLRDFASVSPELFVVKAKSTTVFNKKQYRTYRIFVYMLEQVLKMIKRFCLYIAEISEEEKLDFDP